MRFPNKLIPLLFFTLFVIILTTYRDYPFSYDEPFHWLNGEYVFQYYKNLLTGQEKLLYTPGNMVRYGGFWDLLNHLFTLTFPIPLRYEIRHLFNALLGLWGFWGLFKLGSFLFGRRAGFFSLILTLCFPRIWGHLFINPKDIPFAVFVIWSIYFTSLWLYSQKWKHFFLATLMLAMLCSIRLTGLIYLIPYLLTFFLILHQDFKKNWPYLIGFPPALGFIHLATCFFTPWFWGDWIYRPLSTLFYFQNLTQVFPVFFMGKIYPDPASLPGTYPFIWLFVTLPIFSLFLLFSSLLTIPLLFFKRKLSLCLRKRIVFWVSLLLPLFILFFHPPHLYNGLRHLLFLLFLLHISIGSYLSYLFQQSNKLKLSLLIFLIFQLVSSLVETYRLHPYQYVFFNALVPRPHSLFEVDYWGLSHKEALVQLRKISGKQKITVSVEDFPSQILDIYRDPKLDFVSQVEKADFVISRKLWKSPPSSFRLLFSVKRQSLPLCYVFARYPDRH